MGQQLPKSSAILVIARARGFQAALEEFFPKKEVKATFTATADAKSVMPSPGEEPCP
jgi:hypothetical protein